MNESNANNAMPSYQEEIQNSPNTIMDSNYIVEMYSAHKRGEIMHLQANQSSYDLLSMPKDVILIQTQNIGL